MEIKREIRNQIGLLFGFVLSILFFGLEHSVTTLIIFSAGYWCRYLVEVYYKKQDRAKQ